MRFSTRTSVCALTAALACGALSQVAEAQDGSKVSADDNVIVITSNRRAENLQKAATSVAPISGLELQKKGVNQLDDALKGIAGVVVSQGPTGMDPSIRGVGPNLPAEIGGDAGISTTYDGVYNSANIAAMAGYYDLARIEVVRGPQGTLYGRNAEGGAVNVISNDPTQKFEAAVSANIGNYNLYNLTGMVNFPITDKLAVRIAGSTLSRDGYLTNGQNDAKASALRVKALYKPNDTISLLIGAEAASISGAGEGTVAGFIDASSDEAYNNTTNANAAANYPTDQYRKRHGYKVWTKLDADLGFGTLTVLPSYQFLSAWDRLMYSGVVKNYATGLGGLQQRAFETRLASKDSSRLKWIVGAYYYGNTDSSLQQEDTTLVNGVITPSGSPYDVVSTAKSTALFAQANYPVTDRWRVTVGVRKSWDAKSHYSSDGAPPGVIFATSYGKFNNSDWKLGTEYDITTQTLFYATVATGYRPGGISPAPPNPTFNNENLTSYEVGLKNDLFDHRLRINASLYDYIYEGYQLSNVRATPSGILLDLINLPKVVNIGGELEGRWMPSSNDRVTFALALLDSEIKESQVITTFTGPVELKGAALPNSPKLTFSGTYDHDFHLPDGGVLTPSIGVRYSSSYYVTIPENAYSTQQAYWAEDANLTYQPANANWSLTVYGKNLSDTVIKSNYISGELAVGAPRTYGVTLNTHF